MIGRVNRRRDFSLVELLVVVVILVILISLLLPTVFAMLARADTARCAANLRQIGMAHIMFQDDNNSRILNHYDGGSHGSWLNYLYVDMDFLEETLQCPATGIFFTPEPGSGSYSNLGIRSSFIMNGIDSRTLGCEDLECDKVNRYGDWNVRGWQDGVSASLVTRPESTIFITEIPSTWTHLRSSMAKEECLICGRMSTSRASRAIESMGYPVRIQWNKVQARWSHAAHGRWDDKWLEHDAEWTHWANSNTDIASATLIHINQPLEERILGGSIGYTWDNRIGDRGAHRVYFIRNRQVGNHHRGGFNALMGGGSVQHFMESLPRQWIAYEWVDE